MRPKQYLNPLIHAIDILTPFISFSLPLMERGKGTVNVPSLYFRK